MTKNYPHDYAKSLSIRLSITFWQTYLPIVLRELWLRSAWAIYCRPFSGRS